MTAGNVLVSHDVAVLLIKNIIMSLLSSLSHYELNES